MVADTLEHLDSVLKALRGAFEIRLAAVVEARESQRLAVLDEATRPGPVGGGYPPSEDPTTHIDDPPSSGPPEVSEGLKGGPIPGAAPAAIAGPFERFLRSLGFRQPR